MSSLEPADLADRITRLEVLRDADRERMDELRTMVSAMSAKLDLLVSGMAATRAATTVREALLRGAVPAVWLALVGVVVVIVQHVFATGAAVVVH